MMKKLRSNRGESLGETLCAILVAGLAISLLLAMLGGTRRLDNKTSEAVSKLYASLTEAEQAGNDGELGEEGTISVKVGTAETKDVHVTFYGSDVISYRPEGGVTP